MRNTVLLLLLLFSNHFCNIKQKSRPDIRKEPVKAINYKYSVKGTIRGMDSGWIYFGYEDTTGSLYGRLDSVKVIREHFEKYGQISEAQKAVVGITYKKRMFFAPVIFIDIGNLTIDFNKDSLDKLTASGNKAQDEFNDFTEKYNPLIDHVNEVYFTKLKAERKGDQQLADSLSEALKRYDKQRAALIADVVKAHPASIVSAYIVAKHLTINPDPEVLEPLYAAFSENVKSSFHGREVFKALQVGNITPIGVKAPDFTLPDKSGNKISLASFQGKYTLVDFWASWCGPCRAENLNLLRAYATFKEKGFTIISISLDDNKQAWLKAIAKDKLPWLQVSDLKGSNSEVKEVYGIKAIPMNYLLDKEGRIIAKNLRGEELQKKLREVLL